MYASASSSRTFWKSRELMPPPNAAESSTSAYLRGSACGTVLVTTHYMHEAEVLCDKIVILDKGRVVGTGAPREMIERETPGFVGIFPAGTEEVIQPHLDPSWELFHQGRQCCVRAPRFDDLLELQRLSGQTALQLRPANLEDVYLKLTGSELSDDE